jgi:hypothetical protein
MPAGRSAMMIIGPASLANCSSQTASPPASAGEERDARLVLSLHPRRLSTGSTPSIILALIYD